MVHQFFHSLRQHIHDKMKHIFELDNIIQYEHGDKLVISEDIPHGNPTENCKDIVLNLFWHHLNMNLGGDELSISHRTAEKPINGIDNRNIFIKPTRKKLAHKIVLCNL